MSRREEVAVVNTRYDDPTDFGLAPDVERPIRPRRARGTRPVAPTPRPPAYDPTTELELGLGEPSRCAAQHLQRMQEQMGWSPSDRQRRCPFGPCNAPPGLACRNARGRPMEKVHPARRVTGIEAD